MIYNHIHSHVQLVSIVIAPFSLLFLHLFEFSLLASIISNTCMMYEFIHYSHKYIHDTHLYITNLLHIMNIYMYTLLKICLRIPELRIDISMS